MSTQPFEDDFDFSDVEAELHMDADEWVKAMLS